MFPDDDFPINDVTEDDFIDGFFDESDQFSDEDLFDLNQDFIDDSEAIDHEYDY